LEITLTDAPLGSVLKMAPDVDGLLLTRSAADVHLDAAKTLQIMTKSTMATALIVFKNMTQFAVKCIMKSDWW
jgi:hypothetical protein